MADKIEDGYSFGYAIESLRDKGVAYRKSWNNDSEAKTPAELNKFIFLTKGVPLNEGIKDKKLQTIFVSEKNKIAHYEIKQEDALSTDWVVIF